MTDYSTALVSLKKACSDQGQDRLHLLTEGVLRACGECEKYCAEFPNGVDPTERWRREQNAGKKQVNSQIKAARKLAVFAREHPQQAGISLLAAGFKGRRIEEKYPIDLEESFADLLSAYEKHLVDIQWTPFSFLKSTQYFNMIFPKTKKRRPPSLRASTGLMLRLVMIFRKFTKGEVHVFRYQIGETIPTRGEAHFGIAAEFAALATGDQTDGAERAITELLRTYPSLGIGKWPTLQNS